MNKLKYIFIIGLYFTLIPSVDALDIEYGTILSTKTPNVLIEYSGIDKKQNFICSVTSRKCTETKKVTLGITKPKTVSKSLQQELVRNGANRITLSPSGNFIAYYTRATDTKPTRTYTIRNLKTNKEYRTANSVSYWDLVNDQSKVFDFSPNSKTLIYLDDIDGAFALYKTDIEKLSGEAITSTKLFTTAYQVDDFIFTDNSTLYYIGNTKENPYVWSLYRYNLTTNKDIVIESHISYADTIKKVSQTLVFNRLQEKGYGPAIYNLKNKKIEQFKVPNVNTKKSITNQEIIKSDQVTGVLMTPTKNDLEETYPLVIWLHGGPYRQSSFGYHPFHSYGTYDSILELLRKNNVIILKLDYRGSFGFGRSHAEGIKESVGKGDVEDVMNAITYARARYKISDIYLMGNSYGGYMSLKALTEHPETFAGVVSINGVTDWESLLVNMRTSIFNTDFNGLPDANNRALYDKASIINNISKIGNQKISIIAGEADRTIPFSQATLLYEKLKSANKNVTLISYKGEDHVYEKKETIEDLCVRLFNFVGVKVDPECNK